MHLELDPADGMFGQHQLSPALADSLRGFSLPEDAASLLGALLQPDSWQQQQQQLEQRRISDAASLSPLATPRTSLELGLRAKRPLSASPFPLEGGEGPIRGPATSLQAPQPYLAAGGNYGHALRLPSGGGDQLPPFQSLRPGETAQHGWAAPLSNHLVLPQSQAQLLPPALKREPLGHQEQTVCPARYGQNQQPPPEAAFLYRDGPELSCDSPTGFPYKQEPAECPQYSTETAAADRLLDPLQPSRRC